MEHPSRGVTFIDRVSTTLQVAVALVFVAMNSTPAPALAFSDTLNQHTQPLNFARDEELEDIAIMGVEMWPPRASIDPRHQYQWTATPDIQKGTTIRVLATAYTSSPEETDGNPWVTASGTTVHSGTMAANFLPFGAKVELNGQTYTVEDRLSPRFNGKRVVDLWFPDQATAYQFGVRVMEIKIIELPE